MLQIKAYYSAAIRGPAGDAATQESMNANLEKASNQASLLQRLFGEILTIYCPHQHDRLIQILWKHRQVTTESILQADLQIQNDCDITIVNNSIPGSGVDLEIQNALNIPHPIYVIGDTITDSDILMLATGIQQLIMSKYENS